MLKFIFAGIDFGSFHFAPAIRSKNGFINIENNKKTDTGLPGKQIIGLSFMKPKPSGLPGFIAIFQKISIPIFYRTLIM